MADDFSPEGQLAQAIPGFKPREPQRQMAHAVARAIDKAQPLVVEAGTGAAREKEGDHLYRLEGVAGSALQP